MEGNAFTDMVAGLRRIVFGYTDEEEKALIETGKKLKERQEKGQTTTVADAGRIITKRIANSTGANVDMLLGLFIFLVLVMMFKR
jgi:hypothetical protein